MAIDLSIYHIVPGDDTELPIKLNDMMDDVQTAVNGGLSDIESNLNTLSGQITSEIDTATGALSLQITGELDAAVVVVEGYRDQAATSAGIATTQAGIATAKAQAASEHSIDSADSAGLSLTYRNETRDARDEAASIVYDGDYSVAPAAGNVPIAGPTGTLDKGWVAAEYSAQFIEHINYVLDITEAVRKDQPSNRDTDALVQMLLQISDLAGQAAKTLSGSGEYKASAGSAARCSIAHRTNPGTGVFFPAADEIAFAIDGVEVLRIDSGGIVP